MRHLEDFIVLCILSSPLYFFWRWLYLRFIRDTYKRRVVTWVSSIVISPLIMIGLACLMLYSPTRKFDKQDWLDNKEKRNQMSADIIESKMLIGKSKSEVVSLLGNNFHDYNDGKVYYEMGFPGFGSVGPEVLYIIFNNGKVTKVGRFSD